MTTKKFTKLYNQELVALLRDKTFTIPKLEGGSSISASAVEQFTLFTGQMGRVGGRVRDKDKTVKYAVEFENFKTHEEYAIKYIERKNLLPLNCFKFKQLEANPDMPFLENLPTTVSNLASTVSTQMSNLALFVLPSSQNQQDQSEFLDLPLEDDYVDTEQLDNSDEEYLNFEEQIVSSKEQNDFQTKYNQFFQKHQIHYKRYLDFNFNEGDLVTIKSDVVDENNNEFKIFAGQVGIIIDTPDSIQLRANHVQVVFRPLSIAEFLYYKDELIKGKTTLAEITNISDDRNFEIRGQIHKGLILPFYTEILKD